MGGALRVLCVAVGAMTFAFAFPMTALADTPVTVDCGDGAPISVAADAPTLTQIQASVQGMIDNPSGTTCGLSEASLAAPTLTLGAGSGGSPFVVGGGRFDRGPGPGSSQGCGVNFSLSAHTDKSGFHGEQTYTINNADGCGDFGLAGHVKANVTCLDVTANAAQIKGTVTEVTGGFAGLVTVGDVLESDVVDNGSPSGTTPDMIDVFQQPPDPAPSCAANFSAFFPVENGNITVHQ